MDVEMELSLPPNFFDSAKESNNFESVSERMAKSFIVDILGAEDVRRGDPMLHEPDYIADEHGYEVTLAVEKSLIPQLKGVWELNSSQRCTEESIIESVTAAVIRKAKNTYLCTPSLFVISLGTLITWHYPLYFDERDPFARLVWKRASGARDRFFHDLYEDYIQTRKFENILLVQPTNDGAFVLYDLRKFWEGDKGFITRVETSRPEAFPTYKLTSVQGIGWPVSLKITVVNHFCDSPY